jgi:hypothetical protein
MHVEFTILRPGEVAVMPQQSELTTHGAPALLQLLDQGQGGGAVAEAEGALGDHTSFHHDLRPLGHGVKHRVVVAGAVAEARTVGLAEGAVVVEACLLPAVGGGGPLPTQVMHSHITLIYCRLLQPTT